MSDFDLQELITGARRLYSLTSHYRFKSRSGMQTVFQTISWVLKLCTMLGFSLGRTRLSCHDNRSLGPANTRQHISGIFLLSRQPGFDVHLNGAAQNSRSAGAA
jgi:hypothetical protein